jgi:glyoxylase-like metal-dependent hydrolase (beta-lactamase superfamily II)
MVRGHRVISINLEPAAAERGWNIAGVLETRVHADFVMGAVEAIHAVGAPVFQPADAGSRR